MKFITVCSIFVAIIVFITTVSATSNQDDYDGVVPAVNPDPKFVVQFVPKDKDRTSHPRITRQFQQYCYKCNRCTRYCNRGGGCC